MRWLKQILKITIDAYNIPTYSMIFMYTTIDLLFTHTLVFTVSGTVSDS